MRPPNKFVGPKNLEYASPWPGVCLCCSAKSREKPARHPAGVLDNSVAGATVRQVFKVARAQVWPRYSICAIGDMATVVARLICSLSFAVVEVARFRDGQEFVLSRAKLNH
jgi:hypothetical protein